MSNNATAKEHPLAHILRAIADGVPVEVRTLKPDPWGNRINDWGDWKLVDTGGNFSIFGRNKATEYRVKPEPKVKKWRWVIGYLDQRESNKYIVTGSHYTEEDAKRAFSVVIEKVDSTMIEVDAD